MKKTIAEERIEESVRSRDDQSLQSPGDNSLPVFLISVPSEMGSRESKEENEPFPENYPLRASFHIDQLQKTDIEKLKKSADLEEIGIELLQTGEPLVYTARHQVCWSIRDYLETFAEPDGRSRSSL